MGDVPLILRKILRALLTLWIVVTLTFVVLRSSGDPAIIILGTDATPQMIVDFHHAWGLDRPLPVQYASYVVHIFGGDFGNSFLDGRPALTVVAERLPNTLKLTGLGFVLMLVCGIPAGVVAALNRGRALDKLVVTAAVMGHSVPSFFLAILLILLLSVRWRLLPSGGAGSSASIIMPAITIAAGGAGVIARFTRAAMLDALRQPFVRAMLARGMEWPRTVGVHVMPNAAIPTLTMIGFLLGGLVAGAVITETVFAWPGIGRLMITSVARRDLAVVQCIVLLIAATMVLANLSVDLLYVWLDPRMRAPAKEDS
jgi:peptide/nickel transport system permease protein